MWEKITEFKNKILIDPLAKGIFIIASGSAIAQIIGVVTMPVITRLYSPADFGVLGLFTAVLSVLIFAGGFRYDTAFPLPKDDKDAANLFIFFLILLSISTLCFCIILFLFGDFIFSIFHLEILKSYLILLIICFFGWSLYGGLSSWVSRYREYTRITYTIISQSFGGATSKIILGILSAGPIGLLIGFVLFHILGIGSLLRYMWENDRHFFEDISWSRMTNVAKQYIQFPLFSFPDGIINSLAFQLPIFMLSVIYGLKVVGMYSLAYSVLIMTSSLISSSMGQVYYAEVANMMRKNSREIKKIYISTTKKLLVIGIPLIMIPCILAPIVFPIFFGDVWKEAGFFCLPLSLVAISNFVISPTTILGGYGYNHWTLIWDISRTGLIFAGLCAAQIFSLPVISALFIYSGTMTLMYGIMYLMNIRALDLYLGTNP